MKYNYCFKNKDFYKLAMTHISYANDNKIESNQRLEFLGDSILSFIVATYIYNEYKKVGEGTLTQIRANAVCEKTLALAARNISLGEDMVFGKSEKCSGGVNKDSVLADAYEATLAAIYLDGGIEPAKKFVFDTIGDMIGKTDYLGLENYKSEIQNYYQKRDHSQDVVEYRLVSTEGFDHAPIFNVVAVYRGKTIGSGKGKTRKSAEQLAAKMALESLKHKEG